MCSLFTISETNITMGTNNDISLMECGWKLPTFHRTSVNLYKNRWHSILQAIVIIVTTYIRWSVVTTVSQKPLIFVRGQKRLLYPLKLPTPLCLPSLNDTELCDCEGTDEIFQVIWRHSLKHFRYIAFNGKVFINPGIRRERLKKNMKYISWDSWCKCRA
jgi:hypothetical protein